jgi:hypothetical protein
MLRHILEGKVDLPKKCHSQRVESPPHFTISEPYAE